MEPEGDEQSSTCNIDTRSGRTLHTHLLDAPGIVAGPREGHVAASRLLLRPQPPAALLQLPLQSPHRHNPPCPTHGHLAPQLLGQLVHGAVLVRQQHVPFGRRLGGELQQRGVGGHGVGTVRRRAGRGPAAHDITRPCWGRGWWWWWWCGRCRLGRHAWQRDGSIWCLWSQ